MGDMDKSEKFTAAGYLFIPIGMFMFADADVVMRCYGDERAALIEFIIGVIAVVIATVSLYIAGMLRDRRIPSPIWRQSRGLGRRRLSSASRAHGTAMRRGGYTDSPMPRTTTASPRPSHHQMTLTSLGMIGYAHVEDDEGTSSPRTPQRHRPPRRFTAAHMTRRLTRWIMGAHGKEQARDGKSDR